MKIKIYIYYLTLLFTFFNLSCVVHNSTAKISNAVIDTMTIKSARDAFKKNLYSNVIKKNINIPLSDSTEKNWEKAFGGMELALDTNTAYIPLIKNALDSFDKRTSEFQRSLLEVVYTLYPNIFYPEILNIVKKTSNTKIFAMGVNYLLKNNNIDSDHFLKLLQKKFVDWNENPILFSLNYYLKNSSGKFINRRPPLVDLLSHNLGNDNTIIFSIQRKDRDFIGIAIVRKPNGNFVRNSDGTIFYVPQLARSITNLPYYLTNGNTPQGILSIQGIDTSKNVFIGKTPNIQLVLPYEAKSNLFLHSNNSNDTLWTNSEYSNLLPESWRNYVPIWGTYYAGKAGRTEIIAHGTTIDPSFYFNKSYYPSSPTLGCLCAKEIWSENDGSRLESDQAALVNALLSTGSLKGYCIVVNKDNKKMPVVIDEVTMDILKAEKIFHSKN